MEDLVTIYSGEHGAYWGEMGGGYTSAQYAGVYTREDALRLTSHCGPEKRIEIETVPEDHVPTLRARIAELTVPAAKWNAAMREATRMNVTCLDTAKGAILSLVQQLETAHEEIRQIEACVENDDCPDLPLVTRVASVVANLQNMIGKWHEAKTAGDKLLSSVLSVRQQNTAEWMTGIAEDINAYAEATGEPDRVAYNGDGLRIVKGDGNGLAC